MEMFTLDTANEVYLAAGGTIIKAQLQRNKLILEKLSIYDGIGTVKVVLASGFVGEANEAQLTPIPSGHLNRVTAVLYRPKNCLAV